MNRVIRRLDSIHSQLINTVAPLEERVFSQKPADDQWSVAEILHHLCLVESAVTVELEKCLAAPPQKIAFLRKFIPPAIVAYRGIRVKAPRGVNPLNPPAKAETIENFNSARSKLKELCVNHGPQRLKQVIFKHPFLGNIDGMATISFVGYHEIRHFKQIQEVLRKLRRNGA